MLQRWVPWGRLDYRLDKLVESHEKPERIERAKTAAAAHESPRVYKKLTYTEQEYLWTLLYNHMRRGQIDPRHLRRMRATDLEYMAAATPSVKMSEDERTKLAANIARATRELHRRHAVLTGLSLAFAAALIGIAIRLLGFV